MYDVAAVQNNVFIQHCVNYFNIWLEGLAESFLVMAVREDALALAEEKNDHQSENVV